MERGKAMVKYIYWCTEGDSDVRRGVGCRDKEREKILR